MLRSIYNRGVESGRAPYVHRLFHDVYTGVDICQKKALPVGELNRLLYEDPKSERLRRTQAIAALMFQFCGMSFADLAHLEKSSLERNIIRYNRIKTKTPMSVEVLGYCTGYNQPASQLSAFSSGLSRLSVQYPSWRTRREKMKVHTGNISPLSAGSIIVMRDLQRHLRLTSPVTSYTIRHSWLLPPSIVVFLLR